MRKGVISLPGISQIVIQNMLISIMGIRKTATNQNNIRLINNLRSSSDYVSLPLEGNV